MKRPLTTILVLAAMSGVTAGGEPLGSGPETPREILPPGGSIKGVVIDHSLASTRAHIGSPSIVVLPNGQYVASHDFFGPGCSNNRTVVFGSGDRGDRWEKLAELQGQWWSSLFVHREALYILGATKEYGNIVIRRSVDGGRTWTATADATTGLLRADGQYHCAPMPVITHNGRLWRTPERRNPPKGWGITFCAGMLSAPLDADLLDAKSWTVSDSAERPGMAWRNIRRMARRQRGRRRNGQMLDILRVDTQGCPEKAALVRVSADGRAVSFDLASDFIDFPGGARNSRFGTMPRAASTGRWPPSCRRNASAVEDHPYGIRAAAHRQRAEGGAEVPHDRQVAVPALWLGPDGVGEAADRDGRCGDRLALAFDTGPFACTPSMVPRSSLACDASLRPATSQVLASDWPVGALLASDGTVGRPALDRAYGWRWASGMAIGAGGSTFALASNRTPA